MHSSQTDGTTATDRQTDKQTAAAAAAAARIRNGFPSSEINIPKKPFPSRQVSRPAKENVFQSWLTAWLAGWLPGQLSIFLMAFDGLKEG